MLACPAKGPVGSAGLMGRAGFTTDPGSLRARLGGAIVRSARAARFALRSARRVWPRRAVGAVQGPLEARAETVDVWGWAWLRRDVVVAVFVTADGEVVARGSLGPPPPDVARRRPETLHSSRCGWRASVDLTSWAHRSVTLGSFVVSQRGVVQHLAAARITVGSPPTGVIEVPAAGSTVTAGRVRVAGWAAPFDRPLGRVEVRVGGRYLGVARPLAAPRPDIASWLDASGAPMAGFEHSVTVEGVPGTRTRVEVDVVDLDGRRTRLAPVDAFVAAATASTTKAPASGNGHDPDSRTAASVAATSEWPPRLAVFTHRLDLGGAQLYLQEVLRHLLRNGDVRSCLVVSERDGLLREELEQLGATVQVADYPVRSELAYERRLAQLGRLLRANGTQVAIANTMGAGIGADAAQRLGIPVVWAIHESYIPDDFWTAAYGEDGIAPEVRSSVLCAFARTPAVVFVADATRAAYSDIGDRRRLITIPYGVPLEEIAEYRRRADRCSIRQAAGIPIDATVLLCVGTIEPRKAQAALVVAFAEVAAEFPEAVLVLVGDTGSAYAEGVRELVRRLGMADRVRLETVSPDPHPWYVASDAFVMASDVESMPRALLEAMAFHLPVVVAEVWGVPELVTDACNGLLFPPRDVNAAADALRRLLRLSPHERGRLAETGACTVQENHDVRGYVDAYRTLLHGLAVDPRAVPDSILRS